MKQVFSAHQLCSRTAPWVRISIPTMPRCAARATPGIRERCRSVWSPISAAGWPDVESRRRRLPPSCFGRTFALEHGVDVRQETILSALQRLLELLRRQGVVAAPVLPVATPAERLQSEFRLYLRQERALASTTQAAYTALSASF